MEESKERWVRGSRQDGIPNDVTYNELTKDQLAELDGMMTKAASATGWRLSRMTAGGLNAEECRDDILFHIYTMRKDLEAGVSKKAKSYNVVAYLRTGINNMYRDLLDKYYDDKMVQERIASKLSRGEEWTVGEEQPEERLLREEQEDCAKEDASDLVDTLRKASKKLRIKMDHKDLVITALKIINKGIHQKKLKGELYEKVDAVRQQMEANGYFTRFSKTAKDPRGKGVTRLVKDAVKENPHVRSAELIKKLSRLDAYYNPSSVKVLLSVHKKNMGIKTIRAHDDSSLISAVRRLVDSGVEDLNELQAELVNQDIVFRPSVVRGYLRQILREKYS